jgi:CBS domain-containing protein
VDGFDQDKYAAGATMDAAQNFRLDVIEENFKASDGVGGHQWVKKTCALHMFCVRIRGACTASSPPHTRRFSGVSEACLGNSAQGTIMLAKDIMTKDVVFVKSDARLRDVARLLIKKSISAVPVIDDDNQPIGMVSEGDLAAVSELHRNQRAQWWLAQLAEGEPLDQRFLSNIHGNNRSVREIMASPVISVADTAETEEIARTMETHKIKRVVVLHFGKMVGIVSRADIVRAVASEGDARGLQAQITEKGRVLAAD